jgi:aryl-phospho-beta-D-glucosidase BglC (GH1 family)
MRVAGALLLLALLGAVPVAEAGEAPVALKRGVSIHEWLNWSPLAPDGTYKWPPYRALSEWGSPRDFQRIKAMGFDFVRLSVDPGPLLASDGAARQRAIARLDQAVRAVLASGLKVVLDLHPVGQVPAWSLAGLEVPAGDPVAARYRSVVADVARMLARVDPDRVALELMNEPQFYPCDGAGGREWEAVLEGLVQAAREAAPELTLVVTGACGGNITGLVQLDPAKLGDDNRLLYSFHYYEPHSFTHQGIDGAAAGVHWPENAQDADRLASRFAEVKRWAARHGIAADRILLGEFSATAAHGNKPGAADSDRYRWLNAVRQEAEALGVAWAYWEYSNPYGMSLTSADAERRPDPVVMEALGLEDASKAASIGN